MVSLEQRQALAALKETDPQLERFQLLLSGGKLLLADSASGEVRAELLLAISSKDSNGFQNAATKIEQRQISAESDWCHDDYLLFLLLLGNEMFGRSLTFLTKVIEARRNNPNPIPQKINEVFAALERQEFGIDGELGFLKIPFLHLAGKLQIGPSEAGKALGAMSEPQLFDQLSPFLKLLTQKAYDIVLTERQPIATETTKQLLEGLEIHAKDLSFNQWWHVVAALPGRMILTLVSLIFAAGLIPVLIGAGARLIDSHSEETRSRPSDIEIAGVRKTGSDLPDEVLTLTKMLSRPMSDPDKGILLVSVESAPFDTATPAFVVEVSHPKKSIRNGVAFTQAETGGVRPLTIISVQRDGGRLRAILPKQPPGQRLLFVLEFEVDENEDVQSVGKLITIRTLQ